MGKYNKKEAQKTRKEEDRKIRLLYFFLYWYWSVCTCGKLCLTVIFESFYPV